MNIIYYYILNFRIKFEILILFSFLDSNIPFIHYTLHNNEYHQIRYIGDTFTISVTIESHPEINKMKWIYNKNDLIKNSSKYRVEWDKSEISLEISNIEINDSGIYTVLVSNGYIERRIKQYIYFIRK